MFECNDHKEIWTTDFHFPCVFANLDKLLLTQVFIHDRGRTTLNWFSSKCRPLSLRSGGPVMELTEVFLKFEQYF